MSIWGKVIGGVAGFALGGPLGGLLGAVAGHSIDKMKETEAGKVMNFKVIIRKETKPTDVRYCDNFTQANTFLLKYFNFSCHMCERLTSHIWTSSSCDQC